MTHAGRVYVPLTLFIAVGTFMLVYGMLRVNKFLLWFNVGRLKTRSAPTCIYDTTKQKNKTPHHPSTAAEEHHNALLMPGLLEAITYDLDYHHFEGLL